MTRVVAQAEASKHAATANIERKLHVLESWATAGIPLVRDTEGRVCLDEQDNKLLDFYPVSLRQFKSWDGSQNCKAVSQRLPALSVTGSDTLSKRPQLQQRAIGVVAALKIRAEAQRQGGRHGRIRELGKEVSVLKQIGRVRLAELRELTRECCKTESALSSLRSRFELEATEFSRIYQQQQQEIAALKADNADLVAQISKLVPMREAQRARTKP